jgi:hypothetical protein
MANAYPLEWPEGWKRTPGADRRRAPYKTEPSRAVQHLCDELRRLGAVGAYVISTNLPTRKGGVSPISDARNPDDPGVAVFWSTNAFKDRVIACDKWLKVYDNIHAIGLAIEAMRAIDRAGATQVLERAFTAFGALPAAAAAPTVRPWWEVLNFPQALIGSLSTAVTDARFRELSRSAHPDHGGSDAALIELTNARDAARRHYGGG